MPFLSFNRNAQPRRATGHSLLDIGLAVLLLTVLALLVSNIFVIHLARDYNDRACKDAVLSAARAVISGKDPLAIQRAAQDGLNESPQGGYFIEHPTFLEYKDEKNAGVRQLRVQTQTVARVPFPILVMDDETRERGMLAFKSTYIVEFPNKNP
jgi:hypothetical protein